MENSKALIRLPYFGKNGSWSWALITMTILIFQVALMAFHWFILIFVLITAVSFTTKYRILVDKSKSVFKKQIEILWMPITISQTNFIRLKHVEISTSQSEYVAHSRGRSRTVRFTTYSAWLIDESGGEYELFKLTDSDYFYDNLRKTCDQLNLHAYSEHRNVA